MSEARLDELADRLDGRDLEYIRKLDDAELRETIVSTILRYQQPEGLAVGARLPDLAVHRLEDGERIPLSSLLRGQPLVLVFGSFT